MIALVSFDYAVWDGPRPVDDAAAEATFDRLLDAVNEMRGEVVPPTAALDRFITDLERRWPLDADDAPWALSPIRPSAHGPFLMLHFSGAATAEDVTWVDAKARERGLVRYDPHNSQVY